MKFSVTNKRGLWWAISGIAIIASIATMIFSFTSLNAPIRPGIDFVGGTRIQIARDCSVADNCTQPIDTAQVRDILTAQELGASTIQLLGDDKQILSVRTENIDGDKRSELLAALSEAIGKFDNNTVQIDSVGPTIGEELFVSGILALLVAFSALLLILVSAFNLIMPCLRSLLYFTMF